jgi:hypothetical protein
MHSQKIARLNWSSDDLAALRRWRGGVFIFYCGCIAFILVSVWAAHTSVNDDHRRAALMKDGPAAISATTNSAQP